MLETKFRAIINNKSISNLLKLTTLEIDISLK